MSNYAAGEPIDGVVLNSLGENLLEGLKIASMTRGADVVTAVHRNATCASACFFIFASGRRKEANARARIGVHGVADMQGDETLEAAAATVAVARVAKDIGVPDDIIGKMVITPPKRMLWLSAADLQGMGVKIWGLPP